MKPDKLWNEAVAQINKNPYQFEFNPVKCSNYYCYFS